MRAVVKYANRSEAVEVRDTPVPGVTPGTVLVKVATAGVRGSDIHLWHNTQSASSKGVLPGTLGHESAGTIEVVGRA
jgi:L-iditol 2-dehydrogenase